MNDPVAELRRRIARRHHLVGWWGLLLFLSLGIVLETLHGFKVGSYLDPEHRHRRLLWTLAHAHGTLLALINIGFAVGLTQLGRWEMRALRIASFMLIDAIALLPLGFFLGGLGHTEVDPGPGILLVPVGALFLFVGVGLTALAAIRTPGPAS
jgi:hypothetical protein